ncbi:MAG: drug/metabolite transporter (DMT)-like permease [Verrucomicrobiales bacterium]
MPIVLGILSALFIGVSDTFGRASSRRAESVSHVSTMMLIGVVVAIPFTWIFDSEFISQDLVLGAISGILVAIGLSIVYRAMATSSSAATAPVAGVMTAILPLLWDIVGGTSIRGIQLFGCAIAIASMALVTYNPNLRGKLKSGLSLALLGGVFFGSSVIFAGDTSAESGAWPAVSQRAFGFLAMVLLAKRSQVPVFLRPPVLRFGVYGGIAGAIGMVCLIVGSQKGDLGTVSVIASTYPAVIVVLTTVFDDDEIRWWQGLGVASAIAGTALIALG